MFELDHETWLRLGREKATRWVSHRKGLESQRLLRQELEELDALISDAEARLGKGPLSDRCGIKPRQGGRAMADATGGDLFVRLLHEVETGQKILNEHSSEIRALEARSESFVFQLSDFSKTVGELERSTHQLAGDLRSLVVQSQALAGHVSMLSLKVDGLLGDVDLGQRRMEKLAESDRQLATSFRRITEIVLEVSDRMKRLEERMARLEANDAAKTEG